MEKCSICNKEIVTCAICGTTGQYVDFVNRVIHDTLDHIPNCYHLCPTCNDKLNKRNINLFESNITDISNRV